MSYTKMLFGLKEGEERVKTLKKFIFFLRGPERLREICIDKK